MKISMAKKYETMDGEKARVICIDRDAPYPVVALIGSGELLETFTAEGKYGSIGRHLNDLIEISGWEDFQIDEPVMARHEGEVNWRHRHFAGLSAEGKPTTWSNGTTSWTAGSHKHLTRCVRDECRRPTEEELER